MQHEEYLCNFSLIFDQEIEVRDDFESTKVFQGRLRILGGQRFQITAAAFADNGLLKAAIQEVGGVRAILYGNPDRVRQAISALSWQPGGHQTTCRAVTTNFGWNDSGDAFLVPSGRITADGFVPAGDQADLRVDLAGEELARRTGPPAVAGQCRAAAAQAAYRDRLAATT